MSMSRPKLGRGLRALQLSTFAVAPFVVLMALPVARTWSQNRQSVTMAGNVTDARVAAEASTGRDWLVNGRYEEQHFSPLKQITARNVQRLGLAWYLNIPSVMGLAAEPIEVNGVIYISAPFDVVYAVSAVTGKILWTFKPRVRIDHFRNSWTAHTNRGVAVWNGRVYVGTGDCRLIALDATTGEKQWQTQVCNPNLTGITGSPRVSGGRVYIGYNGGDFGVHGSVVTVDAATGRQLWRFWTVPDTQSGFDPKEPELAMAAKTWTGKRWWTLGDGTVWSAITPDPRTNQVIFGTMYTDPEEADYGDRRGMKVGGKMLFSGCIIAVNAVTGRLNWYYQTGTRTENSGNIVMAQLDIDGRERYVAMTVPKTGIFYVLDARTGKLISAEPLDPRRVPVPVAFGGGTEYAGFHNWWPMSYSPLTSLVYIPASDARVHPTPGETPMMGKLYAWNPVRQEAQWSVDEPLPVNSGVLSTAGNLVFAGQGTGWFDAYAADTGRKLWSINTVSANDAVPITYEVNGVQYVLVPVGYGSGSRLFDRGSHMGTPASQRGPARLLAFRLNGTVRFPFPHVVIPAVPRPPAETFARAEVEAGQRVFKRFVCGDCHGPEADGDGAWTLDGAIPDLRYMPPSVRQQFFAIVLAGTRVKFGMPCFGCGGIASWPFVQTKLTTREALALDDYLIDQSWKAYRAQERAGRGMPAR
jgi:quinohemoprotein ethanol dehydrogenase